MGAVTKNEIAKALKDSLGFSLLLSEEITEAFFDSIVVSVLENGKVGLKNFGTFSLRVSKERMGRNPKTGREYKIPPIKKIVFSPSKFLKNYISNI